MKDDVVRHYDLLIDENNDPVHDPEPLRDYMDQWDGQIFIDKLELDKGNKVLEIGVGTGRLAVRTAILCGEFYGIDISPKTIARAKDNLKAFQNATLICDDFLKHIFSETFDVIYSSLTFMHIEEKQKAVNKIADLLKDNGRFVLSIDKNQDGFIDMTTRKIAVYPDDPEDTATYMANAGLQVAEQFETGHACIFVAVKRQRAMNKCNKSMQEQPLIMKTAEHSGKDDSRNVSLQLR